MKVKCICSNCVEAMEQVEIPQEEVVVEKKVLFTVRMWYYQAPRPDGRADGCLTVY